MHRKKAKNVIGTLEDAIEKLGSDENINPERPTAGNAGFVLANLLGWAKEHPEARFGVKRTPRTIRA